MPAFHTTPWKGEHGEGQDGFEEMAFFQEVSTWTSQSSAKNGSVSRVSNKPSLPGKKLAPRKEGAGIYPLMISSFCLTRFF